MCVSAADGASDVRERGDSRWTWGVEGWSLAVEGVESSGDDGWRCRLRFALAGIRS